MCVVSVVVNESQKQWGQISNWPLQQATEMQEIIRRLAEIDKKLGAKDCVDPVKEKFLKDLAERVSVLEQSFSGRRSLKRKAKDKVSDFEKQYPY